MLGVVDDVLILFWRATSLTLFWRGRLGDSLCPTNKVDDRYDHEDEDERA